jgi:hypothetical protein
VMSNRTALYKHTDRNLLAIVTASAGSEDEQLNVHVIDASNGRIAHRAVLRHARECGVVCVTVVSPRRV